MTEKTITEALAELKTIQRRLAKKRQFIRDYLVRQERIRDPLEKEGGSFKALESEMQAIRDLDAYAVSLRNAINRNNLDTTVTIDGETRTVADWIVWRRDVAPHTQTFLGQLRADIQGVRKDAAQKGLQVVNGQAQSDTDVHINVNERKLAEQMEHIETVLGELDGKLSLHNATTTVTV